MVILPSVSSSIYSFQGSNAFTARWCVAGAWLFITIEIVSSPLALVSLSLVPPQAANTTILTINIKNRFCFIIYTFLYYFIDSTSFYLVNIMLILEKSLELVTIKLLAK